MLMSFYLRIMELNKKDVAYLTGTNASPFIESRTFRIFDFLEAMEKRAGIPKHWIEGVECELLKSDALGWKKGKLRIRLEFEPIPDEPEASATEANTLDALRSKLDL